MPASRSPGLPGPRPPVQHADVGRRLYRIDFNYVAERWASPFRQIWDVALLWLAMVHGANGMRTIIGDYARKNTTKFWLRWCWAPMCWSL